MYGTGIQESSNPQYDSSHLKGSLFIDAKAVNNFWIDDKKVSTFNKEKVHRIRSVSFRYMRVLT